MRQTELPRNRLKDQKLSVFGNAKEADELLKGRHAYVEPSTPNIAADPIVQYMSKAQMEKSIERTRKLMQEAARKLEFIEAAQYRDELLKLEGLDEREMGIKFPLCSLIIARLLRAETLNKPVTSHLVY